MLTAFLFILGAVGAVIGSALPLMGSPAHFVHNQILLICLAISSLVLLGLTILSILTTLPWWIIALGPCIAALAVHAWVWISLR